MYVKTGTDKTKAALLQINQALAIIESFGIPLKGLTERRMEKMALAFLAVCGMTPKTAWKNIRSNNEQHRLTTREVITYINKNYNEKISSGSYDDIRRQDLKLLTVAGIVIISSENPNAARNSPTRRYALNPDHAVICRMYADQTEWQKAVFLFMKGRKPLSALLASERKIETMPIEVNGKQLVFSPGIHNKIQKLIVEDFLPRYGYGAKVLYIGDAAKKFLHVDKEGLRELNFFEIAHGELPDIIAYSKKKNWLYLIEAVHSSGPINSIRRLELKKLSKKCTADIVYVTAFLDRKTSQKFIADIAWETEVWIAENPDHLIHFNGDKFLGPYKET